MTELSSQSSRSLKLKINSNLRDDLTKVKLIMKRLSERNKAIKCFKGFKYHHCEHRMVELELDSSRLCHHKKQQKNSQRSSVKLKARVNFLCSDLFFLVSCAVRFMQITKCTSMWFMKYYIRNSWKDNFVLCKWCILLPQKANLLSNMKIFKFKT